MELIRPNFVEQLHAYYMTPMTKNKGLDGNVNYQTKIEDDNSRMI